MTHSPQTYASQPGPYQTRAKEIYAELRQNIVNNVIKVRPHFFQNGSFHEITISNISRQGMCGNNTTPRQAKGEEGK